MCVCVTQACVYSLHCTLIFLHMSTELDLVEKNVGIVSVKFRMNHYAIKKMLFMTTIRGGHTRPVRLLITMD